MGHDGDLDGVVSSRYMPHHILVDLLLGQGVSWVLFRIMSQLLIFVHTAVYGHDQVG